MKQRFKELRKYLGLSQGKFAEDLGVPVSNICSYELGRRTPATAFLNLVCNKYNVNYEWLANGTGEMLLPHDRESELAEIAANIFKSKDDSFKLKLIKYVANMSDEQIQKLKEVCEMLINDEKPPV